MKFTRTLLSEITFYIVALTSFISLNVSADDIKLEDKAKKLSDIAHELAKNNVLKQIQYEADLSNGLLWIRTCELLGNDFIITRTSLPKEAILDFIQGKNLDVPPPTMGYAVVGEKPYAIDLNTKAWVAAPPNLPHLDIGVFDYLTVGSSYDFQHAIESLKRQSESLIADSMDISKDQLLYQLTALQNSDSDTYSFRRGKYLIDIKTAKNGMIREWKVTKDGVPVRKIINSVLPDTKLAPLSVVEETTQVASLRAIDDLFKAQGKTPSLGVFLIPNPNGDYIINYVYKDGPADRAELHVNDTVTHINGVKIKSLSFDKVKQLLAESVKVNLLITTPDGINKEKVVIKDVLPSGH